jgi:hypothetical protein
VAFQAHRSYPCLPGQTLSPEHPPSTMVALIGDVKQVRSFFCDKN